jgi:uncharacterized protein (DUF433 family)
MKNLTRITFDPNVMGGKPCIRGMRVTVGMIVGLIAAGHSFGDILKAYPYLEEADVREALTYEDTLEKGALVTVDEDRSRVRILPFS